jgi:hypothetical protein
MVAELSIKMKNKISTIFLFLITYAMSAKAQVQVREEPRHVPVLQNKYFRLLDVRLAPGDTTLFHIHSTPSLFVILSHATTAWQEKGKEWVKNTSVLGKSWYRSFTPDALVHRVCNIDSVEFHVNDIELLSTYQIAPDQSILPFDVLFDNEKATAYRITNIPAAPQIFENRGPIIVELISNNPVYFHNDLSGEEKQMIQGKYLYISPGTRFYFKPANEKIDMVLFEIK